MCASALPLEVLSGGCAVVGILFTDGRTLNRQVKILNADDNFLGADGYFLFAAHYFLNQFENFLMSSVE